MEIFNNPARSDWDALCKRSVIKDPSTEERVRQIIDRVRTGGDAAIRSLTTEIDGFCPSELKVSEEEFEQAGKSLSPDVRQAIENAYSNIYAFHKAQKPARIDVCTAPGVTCSQKPVPIGKVGLYIPGGTAPLFSTVLMLAIPSQIAGCGTRVICTPCGKDGKVAAEVLYAAARCGIKDVFKIGGAQAVAAMAYGTESVPKVYKIFGPGNRYVTFAKQIVSGDNTSIDMPAGPSEVMVLADSSARVEFVAADLLSQAEHGRDSQAMLVCNGKDLAVRIMEETERQMKLLDRTSFIASSLEKSRFIVLDSVDDMIDFAECYAPEHLIISMKDAEDIAERITNAGSIFIGNFSPESAGDYASGTNHTLPTSGWARSCNGVNVDSFMKKLTLQKLTQEGLEAISQTVIAMAEAEGLEGHANAVKVRMGKSAAKEPEAFDPLKIARENIRTMAPYSTARDDYKGHLGIFLDANESPFENGFNRYPDPHQKELKSRISEIKGIKAETLFIGNGSDEAIDLMFRVFCTPGVDNVVAIAPSYGMYKVAAATNDIEVREYQLADDFSMDIEGLLACTDSRTKLIFLCSPNNPSGNAFSHDQIEALASSFKGIVIVDEAYADFSSLGSIVPRGIPNVVVFQTLSKAWGMAGLRLGLCIASPQIITLMSMIKYPYNISRAAMNEAMRLLQTPVSGKVELTISERKRLEDILPGISCVRKVYPSEANFLLVKFDDPDSIYDLLIQQGIIVRNRSRVKGCEGCLRITVGTVEENEKLIQTLRSI